MIKYNTFIDAYVNEEGLDLIHALEAAYENCRSLTLKVSGEDFSHNVDVAKAYFDLMEYLAPLQDILHSTESLYGRMKELYSDMDTTFTRVFSFDDKSNIWELDPDSDEAMAALAADGNEAVQYPLLDDGEVTPTIK